MLETTPLTPADRLIVQISRWDSLKDTIGVLHGFERQIAEHSEAHLVLAGPSTDSVADDPEGARVYAAVGEAWQTLPAVVRSRVHLAALPMSDTEENAAIVNGLQRHADVVVQRAWPRALASRSPRRCGSSGRSSPAGLTKVRTRS